MFIQSEHIYLRALESTDLEVLYTSENNTEWETVEGLRQLIVEHVDPTFKP